MNYTTIQYDLSEGICTIALNRPDVFNACNEDLTTELQHALKAAQTTTWFAV